MNIALALVVLGAAGWATGDTTRIARGKEVYEQGCVLCHGRDGRGNPEWESAVHPVEFIDCGTNAEATEQWETIVRKGGPARGLRAYLACRDAFEKEAATNALDAVAADKRLDDQIRALRDNIAALQSGRVSTVNTNSSIQRLTDQVGDLEGRRHRSRGSVPPTPPGVSLALGSAYFRNQQLADAEREYKAALEVSPNLGEAHNNLGVVYMLTERLGAAAQEVALAEKAGFKVPPALKQDIEKGCAAQGASKP